MMSKNLIFFFVVAFAFFLGTTYVMHKQTHFVPCANTGSCKTDLSLQVDNNTEGMFEGHKVTPPHIDLATEIASAPVLGAKTTKAEKHIYVDLASQTLYAYEGSKLILKTLVSTGKWNITPTGNFHIWEKLRSTRMSGGEGADAYDLPNVPYVMYFYNDFGLHGAYWHDNFGHQMSHGCVNMREVDAKTLYEWADGPSGKTPGTAVSVCSQITSNGKCVQDNPIQS